MNNTASVVFIGHVDAGKSTTCGRILIEAGEIDARTLTKYTELAKKNNRGTWWIAYLLDASEEERAKGKTVELGSASFSLNPTLSSTGQPQNFIIWDAPGHKNYVSNMVAGVFLADFAVLIISARSGEFEAGFERGGQTREHTFLAKASGISKLIVAVNKMDDVSVNWKQARFEEIKTKIKAFLRTFGFKDESSIIFIPISGQTGENVFTKCKQDWYNSKTLMEYFSQIHNDCFKTKTVSEEKMALVTIIDSEKDSTKLQNIGVKVLKGKFEEDEEIFLPGYKTSFRIERIKPFIESEEKNQENSDSQANSVFRFDLKLQDNSDSAMDSKKGKLKEMNILCNRLSELEYPSEIEVTLKVVQIGEESPIITPGYTYTIYSMTGQSEGEIVRFKSYVNLKQEAKPKKKILCAMSGETVIAKMKITGKFLVFKEKENDKHLSRFIMREGNNTIAVGLVNSILKVFE